LKHKKLVLFLGLVVLFITGFCFIFEDAFAQTNPPPEPGIANEDCLVCHGQPDQQTTLPSGEILYLTVDPVQYTLSSHGMAGYACVQCHTDITEYPHPETADVTRRDVTLRLNKSCARCHTQQFDKAMDSVHEAAFEAGNKEAAVCTDCHGAHNVGPPDQPPSRIPQTCERCHSEIYDHYEKSVHGSALIGEGNPDVPSCIDCHGVHDVQGPLTSGSFHLASPLICAKCHADEELMNKYGISTDVFETYISDFHGKTVLFEAEIPGQETNKPVCIDCHGVHNILPPNDPQSQVMKDNLLTTCQKCHPDATTNFPDAWLGHYIPDRNNFPVVYFVDLFYKIFIPVVLGSMIFLVIADSGRRLINRRKERRHA
jgi:hypothetical protein